jgi:hypothetical protein
MVSYHWDPDTRLACVIDNNDQILCQWTYEDFERYAKDTITPSMYHYMAGYVMNRYVADGSSSMQEEAVLSYFKLPLKVVIEMHEQEAINIAAEIQRTRTKLTDLDGMREYYTGTPIWDELEKFVNDTAATCTKLLNKLIQEATEESLWYNRMDSDMDWL